MNIKIYGYMLNIQKAGPIEPAFSISKHTWHMCIYVYTYVYVYMYTHIHIYTYIHKYIIMCVYMYIYKDKARKHDLIA